MNHEHDHPTRRIDREALGDHLDGVRRLVRTMVRDEHEADDVVQETMVAALENRTRVRSGLRAWLAGVARNLARRQARAEGRRARYEGEVPAGAIAPATADVIARAAEQRRILDVVLGMEEPYRSILLLRFIEDLPPRTIAARLAMPVETVRTQVKRGVARLRDRLGVVHGGDQAELRAALALAATEPLGAAHARAVALARASGLVLLIGAGVLVAVLAAGGDEPAEAPPTTTASEVPDDEEVIPPRIITYSPVNDPEDVGAGVPPPPQPATDEGTSSAAADAADEPAVEAPPPVRPIEIPPPPPVRELAEDDGAKAKPPVEGGTDPVKQPRADKPAAGTPDAPEGGGDFYEGETPFSGKQVERAIGKGVAWLIKRQGSDGSWGGIQFNSTYGGQGSGGEGMRAGPTALALYALLKCKTPTKHPSVGRGFDYLYKEHRLPDSSYETSAVLLAVTATADANKIGAKGRGRETKPKLSGRYRAWAVKLVRHLVDKREARGWRYNTRRPDTTPGGPEDLSSTQLAALALFAAHNLGIKTKKDVWEDILAFTLAQQMDEGETVVYRDPVNPKSKRTARARGFAYIKAAEDPDESAPRGGMTACALANLEMARFVLSDRGRKRDAWAQRDDAAAVQTAIFDGMAWLDRNWSSFEDPGAQRKNVYHLYWMYALERAMDLFDLHRVGSHNWYGEMGQELLNRQRSTGAWVTRQGRGHDVLDTCFALLFLKRSMGGQIPNGSITGGGSEPADNR